MAQVIACQGSLRLKLIENCKGLNSLVDLLSSSLANLGKFKGCSHTTFNWFKTCSFQVVKNASLE